MNLFPDPISNPFGLALALSALTHAMLIGALGFDKPRPERVKDNTPPLEIVLVNARTETAPPKADALAQLNLDRGGNTELERRMKTPLPVPSVQPTDKPIKLPAKAQAASATLLPPPAEKSRPKNKVVQQEKDLQQVFTQADSPQPVESAPPQSAPPEPAPVLEQSSPSVASTTDLLARSMEAARLEAIISKSMDDYQKRPKRKFVGARTTEYRFAAYVEAWRQKVEKVGNLNYPAAAKELKLYGSLRMTVSIKADGMVEKIELNKSSGHKVLDEAARRIVELAAPFAEFPPDIRRDTDIIDVTRTWTFTREDTLAGGD